MQLCDFPTAAGTGEGGGKPCTSRSGTAPQHIPRRGGGGLVCLKTVDIPLHTLGESVKSLVELVHRRLLPGQVLAVQAVAEALGLLHDVVGRFRPGLRGHGLPALGHLPVSPGDLVQRRVHLRLCSLGGLVSGDAALDDREQKRCGEVCCDLLVAGLLLREEIPGPDIRTSGRKAARALPHELHKRGHHPGFPQYLCHSAAHKATGKAASEALRPGDACAFQVVHRLHMPSGQCSGVPHRIGGQEGQGTVHNALHRRGHLHSHSLSADFNAGSQSALGCPKGRTGPVEKGQVSPNASHSGGRGVLLLRPCKIMQDVAIERAGSIPFAEKGIQSLLCQGRHRESPRGVDKVQRQRIDAGDSLVRH